MLYWRDQLEATRDGVVSSIPITFYPVRSAECISCGARFTVTFYPLFTPPFPPSTDDALCVETSPKYISRCRLYRYTLISQRTSLQHGERRAVSVHYYDKLLRAKIHLLHSTYFIDIFMKNMQHCIVVSAILRSSTFHYREKLCLYKEKSPGYIIPRAAQ